MVESATPASQLAGVDHPSRKRAAAAQPRNGARKETTPIPSASFRLDRKDSGSSSVPARNVRTIAPVPERNVIQGAFAPRVSVPIKAPINSCATVPTTISESAVEM